MFRTKSANIAKNKNLILSVDQVFPWTSCI